MRWFCLLVLMGVGSVSAQTRFELTQAGSQPIVLESVAVAVQWQAGVAETEISYVLKNPNPRVLEGELNIALLDGQRIESFALDINGELREAVPVEKARGQAVFEEVIRGRVDPALLEKTAGNNFKLRVYPLPALGSRRVVVRIAESARASYRLPLDFGASVERFSLSMSISSSDEPAVSGGNLDGLKFSRKDSWRARIERKDFVGGSALGLNFAPQKQPLVYTQTRDGETFFMVDVPIALKPGKPALPRVLGLLFDASGSAAARAQAKEMALLDRYFGALGNVSVRLIRLRNSAEAVERFEVRRGDWSKLEKALRETPFDGASALSAFRPQADIDQYLLLSDGLSNWGEAAFPELKVPLYALLSSPSADATWLRFISERSAGQLLDLNRQSAEQAVAAMLTQPVRLVGLSGAGVSALEAASFSVRDGSVLIAGVLEQAQAELRLSVRAGSGAAAQIRVALLKNSESRLTASQWANLRLARLDGEYALNRAQIRRLGQRFGMVTRETSLIVLDLIDDYVRFDIEPPAGPLRDAFKQQRTQRIAAERADASAHLAQVIARFNDKQQWWERDFPKQPVKLAQTAGARADSAVSNAFAQNEPIRARQAPPPAVNAASAMRAPQEMEAAPSLGEAKKAESPGSSGASATQASIQLKKFLPDSPAMQRLRAASSEQLYRVYLDERPDFVLSSAFFLDAADLFKERGQPELALRVLSNLAELSLENRALLRVLAYRLREINEPKLAVIVLKRVLDLSPDEPQSYRDLGLALAAAGEPKAAVEMLWQVVIRPWHDRFPEVELIALAELNSIAARSQPALKLDFVDPRLRRNLPLKLRAVLSWDADNTDIDLWVTDPNAEKAYYGNPLTAQGGRMSRDFTGGYGPEEFSLKTALKGKYKVEAQYFGDRRQNLLSVTTLSLNLSTDFGLKNQREQIVTLRLQDANSQVFVGEFEVQ